MQEWQYGTLSGDNDIINEAGKAKKSAELKDLEEQVDLAIIDAEKKHRNPTLDDVIDELIARNVIKDKSQVVDGTIITDYGRIEGKLKNYETGKE